MNGALSFDAGPTSCCTPDEFREGMRHLIGGVTIICTQYEGRSFGLTATAVCSVSAEPPLLLVCLNERGITGNAIVQSGAFSVNLLDRSQQDLAKRFSQNTSLSDRFEYGAWIPGVNGLPLLLDSPASFECQLVHRVKAGSHYIFVGKVERVSTCSGREPLGYLKGQFGSLSH